MDQNRVKQIVAEARGDLGAENENEIRARVQQAVRRREMLERRIKSTRGDLGDLETEAALLDKALAAADNGDVSELPMLANDVPSPCCPPPTLPAVATDKPEIRMVRVPPHVVANMLGRMLATG